MFPIFEKNYNYFVKQMAKRTLELARSIVGTVFLRLHVIWTKTCWTVSNLTNYNTTIGQMNNGQLAKLLIKQRSTEQICKLNNSQLNM